MGSLLHHHHARRPPPLHADLVELGERRQADDEALRRRQVVLDAVQVVRHHGQPRRVRLGWVRKLYQVSTFNSGQKGCESPMWGREIHAAIEPFDLI